MNAASKKDFALLYRDVEKHISKALTDISEIKLSNKKGSEHLEDVKKKLGVIQSQFKDDISYLEENSEWERFTIAFFGETNAGKSTIIESLRVIFNEKNRQERIKENKASLEEIERVFSHNSDQLINDLNGLYEKYSHEVMTVSNEVTALLELSKKEISLKKKITQIAIASILGFFLGILACALHPEITDKVRLILSAI